MTEIGWEEYCELVLSRRKLTRIKRGGSRGATPSEDDEADRALMDERTGDVFVLRRRTPRRVDPSKLPPLIES